MYQHKLRFVAVGFSTLPTKPLFQGLSLGVGVYQLRSPVNVFLLKQYISACDVAALQNLLEMSVLDSLFQTACSRQPVLDSMFDPRSPVVHPCNGNGAGWKYAVALV